jgi:hypothetical protein
MDNDFLVEMLVLKLNQEMKNILKKQLTSDSQSAIINLSNEREDKPFENT